MKKLMIAFAAVAMAACASAATIQWNTGTLYVPNADGSWSTTAASADSGDWFAKFSVYNNVVVEGVDTKGTLFASGTDDSISALGALNGSIANVSTSTKYWIVLDLSYDGGEGEQTLTTKDYLLTTKGTASTSAQMQTLGALSSADKYTAIPEPTSAMLLLLGFAGLALKRKQK